MHACGNELTHNTNQATVQRKTFEGENFHKVNGFVTVRESFLCEIWGVASFGVAKSSNP